MKKFECPVNGWDCPYYAAGYCRMNEEEGIHPLEGCDDAISLCGPLEQEDD